VTFPPHRHTRWTLCRDRPDTPSGRIECNSDTDDAPRRAIRPDPPATPGAAVRQVASAQYHSWVDV